VKSISCIGFPEQLITARRTQFFIGSEFDDATREPIRQTQLNAVETAGQSERHRVEVLFVQPFTG